MFDLDRVTIYLVNTSGWSSEWTRATLPLVALTLLKGAPAHGYLLMQKIEKLGFPGVKGSTLYPLLTRLEERGMVDHQWVHEDVGPGRKIFSITDFGASTATELRDEWGAINAMLTEMFDTTEGKIS